MTFEKIIFNVFNAPIIHCLAGLVKSDLACSGLFPGQVCGIISLSKKGFAAVPAGTLQKKNEGFNMIKADRGTIVFENSPTRIRCASGRA